MPEIEESQDMQTFFAKSQLRDTVFDTKALAFDFGSLRSEIAHQQTELVLKEREIGLRHDPEGNVLPPEGTLTSDPYEVLTYSERQIKRLEGRLEAEEAFQLRQEKSFEERESGRNTTMILVGLIVLIAWSRNFKGYGLK